MKGGTLFSGIGTPEQAMPWVDWRWSAEIDRQASAILKKRHGTLNLGDVTKVKPDAIEPVDLLVFGSPCQSFSVAGKRLGLDDPRGNLALVALRMANVIRPRWLVFENVPGLLSSDKGRDFGSFVGLLGQCGYGWAYRVLDAQYFGIPQRRRRVFLVGYLGDWRRAASVLFESESLHGYPAPGREAGQIATGTLSARTEGGGGLGTDFECQGGLIAKEKWPAETACTLNAHFGSKWGLEDQHALHGAELFVPGQIAHTLRAEAHDASEDGTGRGVPLVTAFDCKAAGKTGHSVGAKAGTLRGHGHGGGHAAVAFQTRIARNGRGQPSDIVPALNGADAGATSDMRPCVATESAVRRLTPTECERLQGFPDGYTAVGYRAKPLADGPRYKALGNSMAVPVVKWIGDRLRLADTIA